MPAKIEGIEETLLIRQSVESTSKWRVAATDLH